MKLNEPGGGSYRLTDLRKQSKRAKLYYDILQTTFESYDCAAEWTLFCRVLAVHPCGTDFFLQLAVLGARMPVGRAVG